MNVAIRCLADAIDASGIPRKVLAERAGIGEPQLSKLTRSAAIEFLDELPDEVLVGFLEKYGKERGFEVREVTPRELDDQVRECIDRLVALSQLRRLRTPTPAKATLTSGAHEAARRRA